VYRRRSRPADTLKVRFPWRPRGSSGGEPPAGGLRRGQSTYLTGEGFAEGLMAMKSPLSVSGGGSAAGSGAVVSRSRISLGRVGQKRFGTFRASLPGPCPFPFRLGKEGRFSKCSCNDGTCPLPASPRMFSDEPGRPTAGIPLQAHAEELRRRCEAVARLQGGATDYWQEVRIFRDYAAERGLGCLPAGCQS
jgi:hypothetical protein